MRRTVVSEGDTSEAKRMGERWSTARSAFTSREAVASLNGDAVPEILSARDGEKYASNCADVKKWILWHVLCETKA